MTLVIYSIFTNREKSIRKQIRKRNKNNKNSYLCIANLAIATSLVRYIGQYLIKKIKKKPSKTNTEKEIKTDCLCKCIAWKYHKLYDSHKTLAMAVTAFYGKEIMLSYGL